MNETEKAKITNSFWQFVGNEWRIFFFIKEGDVFFSLEQK